MAELDLNSLFGQDPRLLQQAMDMQMAKASPEERLYMMGAQGGRALGQGIGSLFGVDVQDPMMKKAAALRALASEYDISTADGLEKYAQAASKIDTRAGFLAGQQAREMRAKQAAIAKDEAAAQASLSGRTPPDVLKAQRIAALKRALPAYEAAGDTETVKLLKDELDALTPADARINYGEEANRVAVANFGKPFSQLTQEQAQKVDQILEKRGITKAQAGRTTVDLSGLKDAGDITSFRKDVQAITKPYQDQIDAADDAISLATMAINNRNFAAVSSLSRSLAKASGETQLSGRDVEAFGIDPSLVGRVADTASRLAQSRPTVDTLTKLRQLAEAIKKKAESRLSVEEEQLQATARASKRFTDEQINTVFRRRPASGGGGNTRTTKSGVTYTVEKD